MFYHYHNDWIQNESIIFSKRLLVKERKCLLHPTAGLIHLIVVNTNHFQFSGRDNDKSFVISFEIYCVT